MASDKENQEVLPEADNKLRDYELVYVVSPEDDEEALESTTGNVKQFITSNGGIVSEEERWGKRKLAYPINRFQEGNYVLTRFKMEPVWSKGLEGSLEISEDVLRHLLIRVGS